MVKPDFSNFDFDNCVVSRLIDEREYYQSEERGPGTEAEQSFATRQSLPVCDFKLE